MKLEAIIMRTMPRVPAFSLRVVISSGLALGLPPRLTLMDSEVGLREGSISFPISTPAKAANMMITSFSATPIRMGVNMV